MNLLRALFFLVVSFEILVSMLSNLFLLDLDSLFKFELILSKNDLLDIVVKINLYQIELYLSDLFHVLYESYKL